MKLLLTSNGISNKSIHDALTDLLGKPIEASNALFIPTAIYPHLHGGRMALQAIRGNTKSPFTGLDWKTLEVFELTALPSIKREIWLPSLEEADALLVWGGDVLYLAYWMQQSGVKDLLPRLLEKMVYVGVSAGSMVAGTIIGETYRDLPGGNNNALSTEDATFQTPEGEITRIFIKAHGIGLIDFAIIPHYENPQFPDTAGANAGKWASMLPIPVYAIDDQTAIKVVDDTVTVVSEGRWKLHVK